MSVLSRGEGRERENEGRDRERARQQPRESEPKKRTEETPNNSHALGCGGVINDYIITLC